MGSLASITEEATITGTDDSTAIGVGGFSRGAVELPATATSTTWTIKGSIENGGTHRVINDSAGSAIATITQAANKIVSLPAEVFNCKSIVFDGNGDESTNTRTFKVSLNSG